MKKIIEALELEVKQGGRMPVSADDVRVAALELAEAVIAEAVAAVESCREEGESDMRTARGRIEAIDVEKLVDA